MEVRVVKRVLRTVARGLGLGCVLAAGAAAARGQAVVPVAKLDINRFPGTWYEVARIANKRERSCVGDVFTLIALGDKANHFQVVDSCRTKKGYVDTRNGSGKAQGKNGDGRMKVTFLWPFSEKHWVLALGPDYGWALVGSPNHKLLWVLSREAVLAPGVLEEIKGKAAGQGFAVGKLVMTPQVGGQVGE